MALRSLDNPMRELVVRLRDTPKLASALFRVLKEFPDDDFTAALSQAAGADLETQFAEGRLLAERDYLRRGRQ